MTVRNLHSPKPQKAPKPSIPDNSSKRSSFRAINLFILGLLIGIFAFVGNLIYKTTSHEVKKPIVSSGNIFTAEDEALSLTANQALAPKSPTRIAYDIFNISSDFSISKDRSTFTSLRKGKHKYRFESSVILHSNSKWSKQSASGALYVNGVAFFYAITDPPSFGDFYLNHGIFLELNERDLVTFSIVSNEDQIITVKQSKVYLQRVQ